MSMSRDTSSLRASEHGVYRVTLRADAPHEQALEVLLARRADQIQLQLEALPGTALADDLAGTLDLHLPGIGPLVDLDVESGGIDLGATLQLLHDLDHPWALTRAPNDALEPFPQLRRHPVGAPDEVVEDGVGVAAGIEHGEGRGEGANLPLVRFRVRGLVEGHDLRDAVAADPDYLARPIPNPYGGHKAEDEAGRGEQEQ